LIAPSVFSNDPIISSVLLTNFPSLYIFVFHLSVCTIVVAGIKLRKKN
jgi:hypothetical protein